MTIVPASAVADAPLLPLSCLQADVPQGIAEGARLLLPPLERPHRCRRAAGRHGARLWRLRCGRRLGLEDGLRRLRGRERLVPPQVRPSHPRPSCVACECAAHVGQGRGSTAHAYASVPREPGIPAVLDADRARLRCRHGGCDDSGRYRARAVGRDGLARHPRRAGGGRRTRPIGGSGTRSSGPSPAFSPPSKTACISRP
jgi:hypothetical protein